MVAVLDGQEKMRTEAIFEISLLNARQCRTEVPVPMGEVRVGDRSGLGPPSLIGNSWHSHSSTCQENE